MYAGSAVKVELAILQNDDERGTGTTASSSPHFDLQNTLTISE
jgi:hypothetical protein